MSHIYDEDLRDIIRSTALELGIRIQEGVYVQLTGPAYESPYEVKMCRILGGDAVGMSTACEAVAANHMGMKMCIRDSFIDMAGFDGLFIFIRGIDRIKVNT